ncbi:MAG TPA: TonB-dependent receptor, partial [Oleiagrimonas sp.]|nr:TonB-dependent receptor [Oleiagrimonas sp.]
FAYGCFYVKPCYEGGSPGNYFAPNGDYDIYDYRSPDDTRVADQARASLDGQLRTGSIKHEITVGVGAFHRTVDRRIDVYDYVGTANIADPTPPVFAPSPNQPGPSTRRLGNWQHTAWLLDRMHFGQHWQWIIGGHHVRLHERTWSDTGVPERDTRMTRTLPQTAVLWQPTTDLTLYASYSEGLSLGKEAPYWTSNDGDFLGPRLTHQIEAGAKYRLTDTLNLTAALYHIRQPYQYAQPDDTTAGFTFVHDGEEVHDGLELGAHGQLTGNLRINASLSYIQAQAENTGTPSYEGHQVVNVPKLRTALYLQYRLPFLPALTILGGWRYAAPNPATPDGVTRVPAYNVFNAGLRYRGAWGQHKMTWRLSVTNLFDEFYWRDTGSSLGDHYLFPGTPRLARLTLTIGL